MPDAQCEIAKSRYFRLYTWRNLWSFLTFFFGATLVVFLGLSIIFFIRATWLAGALTTLGTIIDGAAVKWIATQRQTAVNEEKEAFMDMLNVCGAPDPNKNFAQALEWARKQPWVRELQKNAASLVFRSILSSAVARDLLNTLRQPF